MATVISTVIWILERDAALPYEATTALTGGDRLRCAALSSISLWVRQASRLFKRGARALQIHSPSLQSRRARA
jgi:hypothetical protein